jgi:hypothetical protein
MPPSLDQAIEVPCAACVYHPPNLPPQAYSGDDWAMLQARTCAFEHAPGSDDCLASRKTSCSLVDLARPES